MKLIKCLIEWITLNKYNVLGRGSQLGGEVGGTIMMRDQGGARRWYRVFEWGHSGMGAPRADEKPLNIWDMQGKARGLSYVLSGKGRKLRRSHPVPLCSPEMGSEREGRACRLKEAEDSWVTLGPEPRLGPNSGHSPHIIDWILRVLGNGYQIKGQGWCMWSQGRAQAGWSRGEAIAQGPWPQATFPKPYIRATAEHTLVSVECYLLWDTSQG